ncbi:MAG: hypothetical protein Q4A28_08260 [Brachymonas sp.]|nr:hypothetical protein [Brachymonas sp.]
MKMRSDCFCCIRLLRQVFCAQTAGAGGLLKNLSDGGKWCGLGQAARALKKANPIKNNGISEKSDSDIRLNVFWGVEASHPEKMMGFKEFVLTNPTNLEHVLC